MDTANEGSTSPEEPALVLLHTGTYYSRDGRRILLRHQDTNLLGEQCWHGTVQPLGWTTWDAHGIHISGRTEFDVVREKDIRP